METPSRYGEWEKDATFRKARVTRTGETGEVDWAADSAFRFFPIERDPLLGWRLHRFDVATNKALALSARSETRDYVDMVELHQTYPLAAICWAACGKDPGFSPLSLLKMMRRFARLDPAKLEEIQARALNPVALKMAWIEMSDDAEAKKLTIRHGPIQNLDMPAMTMVFKVQSPEMLKSVKVGDAVKFRVEKINGVFTVTAINKATP